MQRIAYTFSSGVAAINHRNLIVPKFGEFGEQEVEQDASIYMSMSFAMSPYA